jgi:hypothetical protein
MWLANLVPFTNRRSHSLTRRQPTAGRRSNARLSLESLEDRCVPTVGFGSVLGVGSDTTAILPWSNAVDSAGNTYVTGLLYGTIDLDPGVVRADGSDILTPRGSSDAFVAKYAPDNSLVWAQRMGSDFVRSSNLNDPFEEGKSIAVDNAGNVYVSGEFVGTADFGPVTLTSAGSTDAFVTKLAPNGNFLWANRWGGGATREHDGGITVDASGNIFEVGSTADVFANGSWRENGFEMRKFNPSGTTAWSKRIDDRGGEADGVAADAAGNVYVVGSFAGTVDFNPDAHKTSYLTGSYNASGGAANGFVLMLTSAGNFGWADAFVAKTAESSTAYVGITDIRVNSLGNVFIGGSYSGPVDFDPSSKVDYRLPNANSLDGFVAKLSASGSFTWATSLGGAYVRTLAVDSYGSVYIVGTFSQTFSPGAGISVTTNGSSDVFVTKLTSSGSLDWYVTFGGIGNDLGTGICVDAAGTVYVVGTYANTVDFDSDPAGTHELTNPVYANMFLLKLKQN